ncbi:hypothetical protein NUW54_g1341 [Trametes sanguinea]|uniref:Uncharacterized protein n=1 Tax=Trametes sanguinea TaxID=158606 RepID=A0ACC1Q6L6_9APHY|nr:hypothetical protein NUW54_g1341 [Trametes sanguinea]
MHPGPSRSSPLDAEGHQDCPRLPQYANWTGYLNPVDADAECRTLLSLAHWRLYYASFSWSSDMNTPTTPAMHAPTVDPDAAIRASRIKVYPRQLWWFIASFIALVSLCHLVSWAIAKMSLGRQGVQTRDGDTESGKSPHVRPFSWRRIPLAIVNAYRVVAFRYTLQFGRSYTLNLAEVFVTCAYIIAIFTWEFVNTTTLAGHQLDYTYWSSRAGAIGASQFPLITALGTKNNVVAYITGISYDKIALYLVPASYDEWFVRVGLTSLIAFTILLLVSLRPIRAQIYEVFYFVHFFTVLIILLGAYFHANNQRVGFYVWPSFLIWGLDRAIRFARLVYYNHLYFGFSSASHSLDATVELLSPHFVRLYMQRPSHFRWTPGQTAFLTMPTVSGFPLEAHPFTIASVDERYQLEGSKVSELPGMDKSLGDAPAADVAPFWNELTFLINVREGFTKRLAAIANEGRKVKVLVDGPYGFSPDLTNDDTVVLVAGGSGVTFTLSTFLGVLSDVQNGRSRCQRLLFIWAIRDASHIDWISKTLGKALELAPSGIEISIRIFVTSGNGMTLYQTQTAGEDDSVGSISEGTRSMRPYADMLPFKKGAFHTAIQAQVPIVPVVCENYWRLYRKGVFESGTLKVKVLPPIPTTGMTSADAGALAVRVHDLMVETLREISAPPPPDAMPKAPQPATTSSRARWDGWLQVIDHPTGHGMFPTLTTPRQRAALRSLVRALISFSIRDARAEHRQDWARFVNHIRDIAMTEGITGERQLELVAQWAHEEHQALIAWRAQREGTVHDRAVTAESWSACESAYDSDSSIPSLDSDSDSE